MPEHAKCEERVGNTNSNTGWESRTWFTQVWISESYTRGTGEKENTCQNASREAFEIPKPLRKNEKFSRDAMNNESRRLEEIQRLDKLRREAEKLQATVVGELPSIKTPDTYQKSADQVEAYRTQRGYPDLIEVNTSERYKWGKRLLFF